MPFRPLSSRSKRPVDREAEPPPPGDLDELSPLDEEPGLANHNGHSPLPDSEDELAELPAEDEDEGEAGPQRLPRVGVHQDMATAGFHPQAQVRTPDGAGVRDERKQAPALGPGGWSELTDAEVMLRVAAGDEAGFGLLVEKYRRQMVHFMYRMVHNQAVAEELAQEVFLRVYRARATYRADAKFSTWIYRIATNLGVNYARDTRHERSAQAVYLDQPDAETGTTPDVADSRTNVEQDMLRDARMAAIRKHVMALPERQRQAVLMHKYQDLDYKQIGAILKLSESATKSLLFRAYQTLRERLQEFV